MLDLITTFLIWVGLVCYAFGYTIAFIALVKMSIWIMLVESAKGATTAQLVKAGLLALFYVILKPLIWFQNPKIYGTLLVARAEQLSKLYH